VHAVRERFHPVGVASGTGQASADGHSRPQTLMPPGHSVTGAPAQSSVQVALPWQQTKQPVRHVSVQMLVPLHVIPQPVSQLKRHSEVPVQPPPQFSLQPISQLEPPAQSRLQLPAWEQSTLQFD
jgi:hypothetical protein